MAKFKDLTNEEIDNMSAKEASRMLTEDHYQQVLAKMYEINGMRVADLRKALKTKDIKDLMRCFLTVILKEYE